VEGKYREHVPADLVEKVRLGLQHINLDHFLPSLHECILFKMTAKQDASHEDYVDNADHPCVVLFTLFNTDDANLCTHCLVIGFINVCYCMYCGI